MKSIPLYEINDKLQVPEFVITKKNGLENFMQSTAHGNLEVAYRQKTLQLIVDRSYAAPRNRQLYRKIIGA